MFAHASAIARHRGPLTLVAALAALLACGPAAAPRAGSASAATGGVSTPAGSIVDTASEPALGLGLANYGCAEFAVEGNGLTSNGLCGNGLASAGLDLLGLSGSSFSAWFHSSPALADVVMRYIYKCAAPQGTELTWLDEDTGVLHTWYGGMGLAPAWASGAAASVAEQQVVTACLGALTNRYGVSVRVALEGRTAAGDQIPVADGELEAFPLREGCFFGNLFTNEGVFVGVDHEPWDAAVSSLRACAFAEQATGPSLVCPPLYYLDRCSRICQPDPTDTFYERCTYNGVSYRALVTRLRPVDMFTCGDHVCQPTERCGTGMTALDCSDCGACP